MTGYFGCDPHRATRRARRVLYRDPLSIPDLFQVLLIVDDSQSTKSRVPSYHISDLKPLIRRLAEAGVHNVKLFSQERQKDASASRSTSKDNMTIRALKEIREHDEDLYIALETCLCPYTSDGSCGLHHTNGHLDITSTLRLFGEMAVLQAEHGADSIGPAAMIDGTIREARQQLNSAGYHWVSVMPHMIFRSPFYHIYRAVMGTDAGGASRPNFQIDPYSTSEIDRGLKSFEFEGANAFLTEPGLFLLDILPRLRAATHLSFGCFSVSGEYELLRYGSSDPSRSTVATIEFCRAAKRAGSTFVATYGALEIAETLARREQYDAC
jgi:porphobilinogen synthase